MFEFDEKKHFVVKSESIYRQKEDHTDSEYFLHCMTNISVFMESRGSEAFQGFI